MTAMPHSANLSEFDGDHVRFFSLTRFVQPISELGAMRLPRRATTNGRPIREKEEQRRNLSNAAPGHFEEATDVAKLGTLTARARSNPDRLCRAGSRQLDQ